MVNWESWLLTTHLMAYGSDGLGGSWTLNLVGWASDSKGASTRLVPLRTLPHNLQTGMFQGGAEVGAQAGFGLEGLRSSPGARITKAGAVVGSRT